MVEDLYSASPDATAYDAGQVGLVLFHDLERRGRVQN